MTHKEVPALTVISGTHCRCPKCGRVRRLRVSLQEFYKRIWWCPQCCIREEFEE